MFFFLIITLFVLHIYGQKHVPEEEIDPFAGGFKSLDAIARPSTQSYDRYGNIMLNGRMGQSQAHFNVTSTLEKEGLLSVVFCLQDQHLSCNESGLILCYHTNSDMINEPIVSPTPKQKRLVETCVNMNGVLVSTTENGNGDSMFQVDTVQGKTYTFAVPNHNCFILWLNYNDPAKVGDYEKFGDVLVNPITVQNDVYDMNHTKEALHYKQSWDDVAVDSEGKHIWVTQNEVTAWANMDGDYLVVPFTAAGGDYCCALTARISGEYVSTCYRRWVKVGQECRARNYGDTTECVIPYTVWNRNMTKVHSVDSSGDKYREHTQNQTYNRQGYDKHDYIEASTVDTVLRKSLRETLKNVSAEYLDRVLLDLEGKLEINASLSVKRFFLELNATLGAHYFSDNDKSNSSVDRLQLLQNFTENVKKNLKETQDRNDIKDLRDLTKNEIGSKKSVILSHDSLSTLTENKTEYHTVRNVVKYPDVLRLGQLHTYCRGEESALDITADFGNSETLLKKVAEKERGMGYPEPSVYEKCPFEK